MSAGKQPKKQLSCLSQGQKRKKKRALAKHLASQASQHQAMLNTLKHSMNQQFPIGDQSDENKMSRGYYSSFLSEMETELSEEVFPVTRLDGLRFRIQASGTGYFEVDTRYTGFESESNWQPLDNVSHLTSFADFMKRDHSDMVVED